MFSHWRWSQKWSAWHRFCPLCSFLCLNLRTALLPCKKCASDLLEGNITAHSKNTFFVPSRKRQAYVPKEKVVRELLILDTILPQLVINKIKKFKETNSVCNCICFDENRHHFGRKALHILEKTYVGSNQVKSPKRAKD